MNIIEIGDKILQLWMNPLESIPVAIDLPRLASKFRLHRQNLPFPMDQNPHNLIDWKRGIRDNEDIQEVVFVLLQALEAEYQPLLSPDFSNSSSGSSSGDGNSNSGNGVDLDSEERHWGLDKFKQLLSLNNKGALNEYLIRRFGQQGPVVQVLKCANQSIVLCAIGQLRMFFGSRDIKAKDVKGSWTVNIKKQNLIVENNVPHYQPVVVHRRKEQVYIDPTKAPDGHFEGLVGKEGEESEFYGYIDCYRFHWEVEITLESEKAAAIQSIYVRLLEVEFADVKSLTQLAYSKQDRERIENDLKSYFRDCAINFSELMNGRQSTIATQQQQQLNRKPSFLKKLFNRF